MLTHRLQLLLDEERYLRVRALARQRSTSVAAVIREAIDRGLPAERILAAEPAPVGEVEDLVAELNDLRGREYDNR